MWWKGHTHMRREPVTSDEVHLVDAFLLTALVLEPDLDDTHGQARLLGQLFAHLTRWFWVLVETRLQHLQLFGLDGGTGATAFAILAHLTIDQLSISIVI